MSANPDTLIGHLLTATGLGRTPARDVARKLRGVAAGIEAAIGKAGGTTTIHYDCDEADVQARNRLA